MPPDLVFISCVAQNSRPPNSEGFMASRDQPYMDWILIEGISWSAGVGFSVQFHISICWFKLPIPRKLIHGSAGTGADVSEFRLLADAASDRMGMGMGMVRCLVGVGWLQLAKNHPKTSQNPWWSQLSPRFKSDSDIWWWSKAYRPTPKKIADDWTSIESINAILLW